MTQQDLCYRNPSLNISTCVNDLLSHIPHKEKVGTQRS